MYIGAIFLIKSSSVINDSQKVDLELWGSMACVTRRTLRIRKNLAVLAFTKINSKNAYQWFDQLQSHKDLYGTILAVTKIN